MKAATINLKKVLEGILNPILKMYFSQISHEYLGKKISSDSIFKTASLRQVKIEPLALSQGFSDKDQVQSARKVDSGNGKKRKSVFKGKTRINLGQKKGEVTVPQSAGLESKPSIDKALEGMRTLDLKFGTQDSKDSSDIPTQRNISDGPAEQLTDTLKTKRKKQV